MVWLRACLWPVLLLACPCAAIAQQQDAPQACATAVPSNIDAGVLAPDMLGLLHRSGTFRAQCQRLAAAPRVRVTLAVVNTLDSGRAQTTMRRYRSGALEAEVDVRFGENYRELLAHEFEHVIEQIDGVDLRQEVAAGRAWVVPGGAFETRRAFLAGLQVRREAGTRLIDPLVAAGAPPPRAGR